MRNDWTKKQLQKGNHLLPFRAVFHLQNSLSQCELVKHKNRTICLHYLYFFERCCKCVYTPDVHTRSNGGRFLLSTTRTASSPRMISRCRPAHTGMAAASNKHFLRQNLYYEILGRNQRNIFELKQWCFPFPSVVRQQLSEYFIFTWYIDTVLF